MPEQEQWLLEFLSFCFFFLPPPFFLFSLLSFRAIECQTSLDLLQESSAFAAVMLLLSFLMEIKEEAKKTQTKTLIPIHTGTFYPHRSLMQISFFI